MATLAPIPTTPAGGAVGMRRGDIGLLASGHFVIDACVGAVPAMLPVIAATHGLSDLATSSVLGASLLVSSAIQPAFGALADRRASPFFLWGGVGLAALGLAAAGLVGGYAGVLACVVASGLGVAAFHPEAARLANRLSGGRAATGLAWFMVGGNAGFAAGPLLVALAIPFLGVRSTLVVLPLGIAVTLVMLRARARMTIPVDDRPPAEARRGGAGGRAVCLLLAVTSMRTWTQFCLLALVPLFLVGQRGASEQAAALAVGAFAAAGAVGTVAGAAVADRVGGRAMLVGSMPLVAPLIGGFLLLEGPLALACLVAAGGVLMASFSVTVALGQEYLPGRLALAAGLMIGFGAIGSAPPGLLIFGALADAAGRETAIWAVAALPLIGAALATRLPASAPAAT